MPSILSYLMFVFSFWGCALSNLDQAQVVDFKLYKYKPSIKSKELTYQPNEIVKRNIFQPIHHPIIIDRKNTHLLYVALKLSKNAPIGKYYMVIEDCFIDRINLYQKNKEKWEKQSVSALLPYSNRLVDFHFPSFILQKNTDKDQVFLFSVHNYYHNSVIPIKIYTENNFHRYVIQSYLTWGVYHGILVFILLISAGMYFLSRDSIFIYVSITIFSGIGWVLFNSGIGFQFLWPNHPELMETGRFTCYQISYLFLLITLEKFLKIEIKNNFHSYFNIGLKSILIVFILLSLNPFHLKNDNSWMSIYFVYSNSSLLLCSFYVLFHLFTEIKNQNLNAWFYFLSIILIFLGTIGLTLMKYEWIEPKFFILYLNYWGILIQVISLVLGLMIEYFNQKKAKAKLEISLIKAQADERQRIAIDMHDELGSSISTIKLISEIGLRKKNHHADSNLISLIYQNSLQLNLKLKEIIWTLQYTNDCLDSLINYVYSYGSSYFNPLGIEFKMEIPSQVAPIPIDGIKRRHILLICKELFANIAQHAQCSKVEFVVNMNESELILIISDNGMGFPTPLKKGNGLLIIDQRINAIQGSMEIVQNNGITFKFVIPI